MANLTCGEGLIQRSDFPPSVGRNWRIEFVPSGGSGPVAVTQAELQKSKAVDQQQQVMTKTKTSLVCERDVLLILCFSHCCSFACCPLLKHLWLLNDCHHQAQGQPSLVPTGRAIYLHPTLGRSTSMSKRTSGTASPLRVGLQGWPLLFSLQGSLRSSKPLNSNPINSPVASTRGTALMGLGSRSNRIDSCAVSSLNNSSNEEWNC